MMYWAVMGERHEERRFSTHHECSTVSSEAINSGDVGGAKSKTRINNSRHFERNL